MAQHSRRQFLRAGGLTLSLGLAGCSLPFESSGGPEATGQQVGAINVLNETDETVTASVFLLRDGDRVYWETHELGSHRSITLTPPTYEGGTGHHIVGVQKVGTNASEVLDVTELAGTEEDNCHFIVVKLTETGLWIGRGTSDEYTNCAASDAG